MVDTQTHPRWWSPRGIADLLEMLVVGERPSHRRHGARPQRAARAGVRKVRIDGTRVVWRSRIGVPGELRVDEISQVLLAHVDYGRNGFWGPPLLAFVLSRDGAVLLRIVAGGSPRAAGPEGRRRLEELWSDAGIPTAWETTSLLGRAKDYRRRWPEAFTFAHAYPVATTGMALAAWILLAVPVLERGAGS
ncbi:hypothetical protein J4G33_12140 [Actinotalea sp. BY-33]|uniref:Uncharacterized protein n=1 Tax=Actinotalea soli TaxID=2819234 RepID=A0A939LRK7_9CELL|nr:hypothetical protein [Actinotalea soli]MBO1752553.1 hypothetical protein [Actinotalea soli]